MYHLILKRPSSETSERFLHFSQVCIMMICSFISCHWHEVFSFIALSLLSFFDLKRLFDLI